MTDPAINIANEELLSIDSGSIRTEAIAADLLRSDKFALQLTSILAINFLISKLWLSLPYFAEIRPQLYIVCGVIFSAFAVVTLGLTQANLFKSAWQSFKVARVSPEVLEVLGLFLCTGLLVLQWGKGSWEDLFFANQLLVLSLFLLSVEQYFSKNFKRTLQEVTEADFLNFSGRIEVLSNYSGNSEPKSETSSLSPKDLRVGHVYQADAGMTIPADSVVLAGLGEVSERRLTAYSNLRVKNSGSYVYSRSKLERGSLLLKVERQADDSVYSTCLGQISQLFDESKEKFFLCKKYVQLPSLAILFVAIFVSIYWYRQDLDWTQILPFSISLLFLGVGLKVVFLFPYLFRIAVSNFFYAGALASVNGVWRDLANKKSAVIFLNNPNELTSVSVADFLLLDDRISESQAMAVLYSLTSLTSRPVDSELISFISDQSEKVEIFDAKSFSEYGDKGLSAVIEGVEFSYGSEEFLIERGVHLQSSDVAGQGDGEIHYLALEEHVVARIEFDKTPVSAIKTLKDELENEGVELSFWSSQLNKQELLDGLAGLGFTSDSIRGNLEDADIQRGLEKSDSFLIEVDTPLNEYNIPTFCFFDKLRWEIDPGKITLFSENLDAIAKVVGIAKTTARRQTFLTSLVVICMFASFIAAILGQLGPVGVLSVTVGSLMISYHLSLRLTGD